MRKFDDVVEEVARYARFFDEKHDQPLAITAFDGRGVLREMKFTRPDAENLLLHELRERAKECLTNWRDTANDEDALSLQCQAVLLRSRDGRHGVIAVGGYGKRVNATLANYGRDYFFGCKPKRIPRGDHYGKA